MRLRAIDKEHPLGFWSDAPCVGCRRPLSTTDPAWRLCPDCALEMIVRLARRIDPAADVEPRWGNIPRPGRVIDGVEVDRAVARWSIEPDFNVRPPGELWPQARALAVVEWYQCAAYEIDPEELARGVAEEMRRLEGQGRRKGGRPG